MGIVQNPAVTFHTTMLETKVSGMQALGFQAHGIYTSITKVRTKAPR